VKHTSPSNTLAHRSLLQKLHCSLVCVGIRSLASGVGLSFWVALRSVLRVSENLLITATLSVFSTVSNQRTLSSTCNNWLAALLTMFCIPLLNEY